MKGKIKGQAQAAQSGEAPSAADKNASTSPPMPSAADISQLEKFVRHFAALTPAEAEATLEEYSQSSNDDTGSAEWQSFVRHTWLPVVSVACGSDWKDNFNSDEVAAMLTLHRSLVQPRSPTARPSGTTGPARTLKQSTTRQSTPPHSGGGGSAAIAAAAGRHLAARSGGGGASGSGFPVPVAISSAIVNAPPGADYSPESDSDDHSECYHIKEDANATSPPAPPSSPTAGQAESVDADGKRRRLRRKRAASPEEHTADGASPSSGGAASSAPSNSTTPSPPRQTSAHAKSNIVPLANNFKTTTTATAATKKTAAASSAGKQTAADSALSSEMMNRVLENISKLNLGNNTDDVPLAAKTTGTAVKSTTTTPGGVSTDVEDEQISLAQSLTLVHDLTHRLNAGLRLHDELGSVFLANDSDDDGDGTDKKEDSRKNLGSVADGSYPATSDVMKTLQGLLGASLGDRMDLLGRTALHVAVASGQRNVVAALVAAGCDVNRELPLDPRILQKYALGGINSTSNIAEIPLAVTATASVAAAAAPSEAEGQLVEGLGTTNTNEPSTGTNVLATVMEPPSWPSKQGKHSVGDHPPDPSPTSMMGSTPVHWAAALGDVISLESLLSSPDVDVNARTIEDATPLHWAARGGHALGAAALCRASGIDLDAVDSYGRTALHIAAAHGHESVVQQLWARGACIDPADGYDWRPLHYATRHGHSAVAAHLVIAGSQVQACDPDGVTAGHLAADRGYVDILDRLLIAGYLPDAAAVPYCGSHGGTTALHLAASHGHLGAVEVLLRWSANPQALDPLGCTPLDLAVMSGHFHIAGVLIQAGSGLAYPLELGDDDDDDGEDDDAEGDEEEEGEEVIGYDSSGNVTKFILGHRKSNMEFIAQGVPPNVPCPALKASLESQGLSVVAIDHAMYPGSMVPWSGVFNITFAAGTDVPHHILLTDDDGKGVEGKITFTRAPPRRHRRRQHQQHIAASRRRHRHGNNASSGASSTDNIPSVLGKKIGRVSGSNSDDSFPFTTHGASSGDEEGDDDEDEDASHSDDDDEDDDDSEESMDDPPPPPSENVASMLRCLHLDDPWSDKIAAKISPVECVYDEFGKAVSFTACAAATGKIDLLEKLYNRSIEMGIDFKKVLAGDALLLAVRCGKAAAVQWLIEKAGCTPETYADLGLLVQTAYRGDVDVVKILLQYGWDPCQQYRGSTALQEAAMCGHVEITNILLSTPEGRAAVDISCSAGYTPLHHAAESGILPLVELLLKAGASVNAVTNDGKTPAHIAAKIGHISVLEILRKAGANLGALDNKQWSPLHCIARRGDLATFVLLHRQTVPLLTSAAAAGLLTAAVRGGSPEMVGALLRTKTATPESCREAKEMPVHAAAREGFLEPLAFLSEAGFDLTAPDEEGRTPLHHVPTGYGPVKGSSARHEAFVAVADVLLAAGCRADTPDSHACTPLHIAAGCGSSDMLRTFMDLAPNAINAADQLGWTPLFWAASEGHVFAVRMLLEGGANPTWKDCNQRIPLHFAAEGGHLGCVTALLDAHIASKTTAEANTEDHNGQTAVQLAAYAHHIECVAAILDAAPAAPPYGAHPPGSLHSARDAEMKRRNALHLAASQGLEDIVDPLLECRRLHPGAKDAEGWAPLHFASAAGHSLVVYSLLGAPGVDVDDAAADGDTPLHKAALGGHVECVTYLLDAGQATVDSRNAAGSTPLYNASSQNHLSVMQYLLEAGAAPDAPTSSGCTPLYIAANNGWPEAVDLLIQNGAKIDLEATQGCTALHAAALNGQTKVIQVLLNFGADVDAQSTNGSTPLHNAAANGHKAAVETLLNGGADTEVENTSGNTPLHMSAGKGWIEVVELLINAGADLTVRNQKGYLAVQSAASGGFFDVVLKLVHSGASWRQKGDADVVKLLSRKTTLRVSYVEGRLRLAEKERHRKIAKGEAVGGSNGSGGALAIEGNPNGSSGKAANAAASAEDLKKAKAQADAVMAALLEEEQEEKAKADRQKKKKEAKKQKKAAQKQAEAVTDEKKNGDASKSEKNASNAAAAAVEEEDEEDDGVLLDEDDIVALAVAEKQREIAAKLEASGKKPTTTTTSASSHIATSAAMSNGNGVSHHHQHQMSFAEAQLRAKPSSHSHLRNGGISAGAAVAAKAAMPIRSASEGLASAPAMPVVRASNTTVQPSVAPPPPPPPPSGQATLVALTPAGPYAAALAGKQPPPPQTAAPVAAAVVPQAPQVSAAAPAASRQEGMPWGDSSTTNPPAPIPQQQQQQQQQARPPRVPPPGFQPDAVPPPHSAPVYQQQQQQQQPDMMHLPPMLPPNHQMGPAPPQQRGSVDGNSGFMPLFSPMDLAQQQQQQMRMQHQQMVAGVPMPIPMHQGAPPLSFEWGLVNNNNNPSGYDSPGMSVGQSQYSLSSSMVDQHGGPGPYLFSTQQEQHQHQHQQAMQHMGGYIQQGSVGGPLPPQLAGSYGAGGMMVGGPMQGGGPPPQSAAEADGIDDVLRMQPWLLE